MPTTTEQIIIAICTTLDITKDELSQKTVKRQQAAIVEKKQIAAYILLKYKAESIRRIDRMLGYSGSANAKKMYKRIKSIASVDKTLAEKVSMIELKIKAPAANESH